MKTKVRAISVLVLAVLLPSMVQADLVQGLGTITATGNKGTITIISYDGTDYDASTDLLLGVSEIYDGSGNIVASTYPEPQADDFSFDQTILTTDGTGTIYLQTIFGTTNSYETFFVFENGGNDDASWYGVKADGSLTTGVWVDASATATATGYTTGISSQSLKGFVFTTDELVAGVRILPGNSLGNANDAIGFDMYSISTIPEPATIGLLSLGSLVLLRRKRK